MRRCSRIGLRYSAMWPSPMGTSSVGPVVSQLLDLARRPRNLPRRSLRPARPPRHRPGPGLAGELARECVQGGYARLEWAVLDWNEPSIRFYRSLGATVQDEWSMFRLDGESLVTLAQS